MNDITKIKVDGELESTYKLFSKNREFEKRAGGNTGSQSGVQSDWNQNDDTQPDYVKNRPFYTETVETVLVEESTVSFSSSDIDGVYMAQLKSTFSPTVGKTYKVYWDGASYECTCVKFNNKPAIGNLSIAGVGSDTGESFLIGIFNVGRIDIATQNTSASHTISISGFVQEVVKIDEKYLPDTVATKSEVEVAQTTANAAQTTANAAQTTANEAQTTANAAQTTANEAQTTAENSKIDPISYNYCATLFSKSGEFIGWYGTIGILSYNPTLGSFYRSSFETTPLKYEDIPFRDFICITNLKLEGLSTEQYILFLTKFNNTESTGATGWKVRGVAISRQGDTFNVNSTSVDKSTGEGLFLELLPKKYMIMNSSTPNSTKKFKITVDDSGALTTTEVT